MKRAILYAGQGSQHTGMGQDLYETYPEFKEIFDNANLSFDIKDLCFNNADDKLMQTEYTQPCMVAFASGVSAILKNNDIKADYVAGLSLGEYSALEAADVLTASEAINIAAFRGKAMADAAKGINCGMTAVLGLDEENLSKCCEEASSLGIVSICNYNCPGQLVISGEKEAVDKASELASAAGAKRCVPLAVSGPFHTKLMSPAGDALKELFKTIDFKEANTEVMFNTLGSENIDNASISDLLVKQVQSSVRMEAIIRRMFELGVTEFIEVGPGKALSGFVKKTAKELGIKDYVCYSVETVSDINSLIENIKGAA